MDKRIRRLKIVSFLWLIVTFFLVYLQSYFLFVVGFGSLACYLSAIAIQEGWIK